MYVSEMFAFFFPGSHVSGLYKHICKSWDLWMPGGLAAATSPEVCSVILSSLSPLQIFFPHFSVFFSQYPCFHWSSAPPSSHVNPVKLPIM